MVLRKALARLPEASAQLRAALPTYSLTPKKYAIRPLLFHDAENEHAIAVIHIGTSLCGHDGIVHGGLLATICDEMLARVVSDLDFVRDTVPLCPTSNTQTIPAFESKTGFTANLNINYRKYVPAGGFIVAKAERVRVDGRKCTGKAALLSADEATTHVDATGLFVTPKSRVGGMISWRTK